MPRLPRTLVALVGAVAIPIAMLLYLANLPGGGRGSLGAILLQVVVVLVSIGLFAIFLARFVEQINARRVRRWLASDEGAEWLAELPADERADFLARMEGTLVAGPGHDPAGDTDSNGEFPVDSPDPTR